MIRIHKSQLSTIPGQPTQASIFASDLGLPVGDWPPVIEVNGRGVAFQFFQREPLTSGGEFAGYNYRTINNVYTVVIFND